MKRLPIKMVCIKLVGAAALAIACSQNVSAANAFECPTTVVANQQVTTTPMEWTAINGQNETPLIRVAFYFRHPTERGALVPDATRRTRGEERVTWTFPRKPGDDFWLSCEYANTVVQLARKLDDTITRCDVQYALGKDGKRSAVKRVDCRR